MKSHVKLSCTVKIFSSDDEKRNPISLYRAVQIVVNSSYDTLTDTAKVTLPRLTNWKYNNEKGQNVIHIVSLIEEEKVIKQGDKIEIYLGYDYDDKLAFTGYITGITPGQPFVLHCEDPMWILKQRRITKTWPEDKNNLRDVAKELLQNTGVEIHPDSTPEDIELGPVSLNNMTIAKTLAMIRNKGILVFFKDGKLILGRSHFASSSNVTKTTSKDYIPPVYSANINVIKDNLSVLSLDKNKISIEGISMREDNSVVRATIILNPEKIVPELLVAEVVDDNFEDYDFEEAREVYELTKEVRRLNINLDDYQNKTHHVYNKELKDLLEDIKGIFFQGYNTGLSGTFTTFGDHDLKTGQTIIYRDLKSPEKNGEYLIRDLTKSYGNYGYRQIVDIPHKVRDIPE